MQRLEASCPRFHGRTGVHDKLAFGVRLINLACGTSPEECQSGHEECPPYLSLQGAQRTVSSGCFLQQPSNYSPKCNAVQLSGGLDPGGEGEMKERGEQFVRIHIHSSQMVCLNPRWISVYGLTLNTLFNLLIILTDCLLQ